MKKAFETPYAVAELIAETPCRDGVLTSKVRAANPKHPESGRKRLREMARRFSRPVQEVLPAGDEAVRDELIHEPADGPAACRIDGLQKTIDKSRFCVYNCSMQDWICHERSNRNQ